VEIASFIYTRYDIIYCDVITESSVKTLVNGGKFRMFKLSNCYNIICELYTTHQQWNLKQQ